MDKKEKQIATKILDRILSNEGITATDQYDGLLQFIYDELKVIQVQARVSPMLADNEKRFLRLLIRDKKEEYGDELKTDIDLIRAVKQESIVKMDLLLEKLQ